MLSFSVLSSGSRANCLYLATDTARVLVDCGLSAKQVELRLAELAVAPQSIQAVVISHEHSDHIAGIRVFAARYGVEVWVNRETLRASAELQRVDPSQIRLFESGEPFSIADLEFGSFSIMHDAADPVAFRVTHRQAAGIERVLGIVTDLGHVTELVREQTRGLDAVVLEANHDPGLLELCSYPWSVKQRIGGRHGHLANDTASELLREILQFERPLQVAVAAHISENSNEPELVLESFRSGWKRSGSSIEPMFAAACPARRTAVFRIE